MYINIIQTSSVGSGIFIRNKGLPIYTWLSPLLSSGTQSCFKTQSDLQIKIELYQ